MSGQHGIIANHEVRWVAAPVANASNTDANSTIIDMADYEAVTFIVPIDDSAATGVATLKAESNDANQDSGMAAISGAQAQATCAVNDDINSKVLVVEVQNPGKRYVQAVITSATANIAFGDMIAILRPRQKPATQGATVKASASVAD